MASILNNSNNNNNNSRAAPIPKFPPMPILRYSSIPIPILPIPEIADTFADTDTFKNNVLKNL